MVSLRGNSHPFLVNEEFIAYLPSLGKALGSIEDAVIAQWLWFKRDRETDETTATAAEIADAIGMSESTLRKRLARLKARDVLTARRLSAYNSTSVWTVHLDRIPTDVSARQSRGDQSGHPGVTDLGTPEVTNLGTSGVTDLGTPSSKKRKNRSKNRAAAFRVVEPSVTGEPATSTTPKSTIQPTPDEKLTAAGLSSPSDRGRFREYLRTVKGARSTEAVIVAAAPEDLASQVQEWRRSLDVANEPDAEPILCEHGHDVALGSHMCPGCDPARQRPAATSPDVEPDGDEARTPDWISDLLEADPALAVPGAFGAPDESTVDGVTPSVFEMA